MGKSISVLIVDDNVELAGLIKEKLEQDGGMAVKGMAKDGLEAIERIRSLKPEIVILDIIMPKLDGIGVLERINSMRMAPRPIFIVLTAIGQEMFIKKAMELGADYFIMKPFDINILITRINQLYAAKARGNMITAGHTPKNAGTAEEDGCDCIDRVVTELITSIGITPNIIGFHYLRDAVRLSLENPSALNSVSKRIYPVIADKYNTTVRGVDRAIRCAIKGAGKKTVRDKNVCGLSVEFDYINKSSNTRVISFFADKAAAEIKAQGHPAPSISAGFTSACFVHANGLR